MDEATKDLVIKKLQELVRTHEEHNLKLVQENRELRAKVAALTPPPPPPVEEEPQ